MSEINRVALAAEAALAAYLAAGGTGWDDDRKVILEALDIIRKDAK